MESITFHDEEGNETLELFYEIDKAHREDDHWGKKVAYDCSFFLLVGKGLFKVALCDALEELAMEKIIEQES
jgi:hypothetical protein